MKLFTKPQYNQLLKNGLPENRDKDHWPVVKLSLPGTDCSWLFTKIIMQDIDVVFGLCDIGLGRPYLGFVRISELENFKGSRGSSVTSDAWFVPTFPISAYMRAADYHKAIITDVVLVEKAKK